MAYHSLEPQIFINTETDQLHKYSFIYDNQFLEVLDGNVRGTSQPHCSTNVMGKYQLQAVTTCYSKPMT